MRSNPLAFAVGKPSFEGSRDVHRTRIHRNGALFKGILHQDPERLHRLEPRMFVRVRPFSRSLDVHALLASHPLRSPREKPSCPKEAFPPRATRSLRPRPYGFRLRLRERCFSPTSATNSLTRALVNRSTPEWRLSPSNTVRCFTGLSPRRLSTTRSQVKAGLTARFQLQPCPFTAFPGENRPRSGHLAAALSTACEADDRPLTLLSRSASPLVAQEVFRTLGP